MRPPAYSSPSCSECVALSLSRAALDDSDADAVFVMRGRIHATTSLRTARGCWECSTSRKAGHQITATRFAVEGDTTDEDPVELGCLRAAPGCFTT